MTTTLPLFWHLSSVSKKERLDATVKLIGALEQFQSNFTPKKDVSSGSDDEGGEDEDEDAEAPSKSDGLDLLNVQDVSYSIRRLVRGLASPRESSRLGFAVALTELLSRIETVTCSQIVALILDGSKTQGSMSGQEERDNLFARLFGLTSVIRSGLLIRSGSLVTSASSSAEVSSVSSFEEVIKELVALGEKKSWLRESAWWTISLAVDALNDSTIPWKKEAPQAVIQQLFMDHDVWSPEKVALALKLQSLYPDQDWRSILSPAFKNPDLLHAGNLQTLARILKESAVEDSDGKEAPKTAATANWKPQLHFVWDVILTQLLPGPNSSHSPKGSFQEFFRIVVDESLFSSTASAERKYWGFQIFQKALLRVNQENMPMLFTKNFMRCWINHLSKQDRYLHKIARQAATDVQTFVQSNPQLGFALILQLTGVHGSQQFDKLTKTKTVESILTSMDSEGIKRYIENLLEKVNGPSSTTEEIHAINSRRSWIIEQLGSLIRSGSIPKEDIWVQTILDWLVVHGLFIIKKKSEKSPFHALHSVPNPVFSDELHRLSRTKLLACIADLNSQTVVVKTDDRTSKMSAVASDGNFWVSRVLDTINTLVSDTKHVSLQNSLEEDVLVHCTKAQEVTAHLKAVTDERQEAAKGVQLLLSATVLQQYCADEEDEVDTEALEASIDGATRMFPQGKKGKKARKSAPADESDTVPEPVDLFVDTIIGFLEKSTAYMRTVGNQVFALLSGAVNESTIDLIVTQLERRDPADLLKDEDEDEDMEGVHEDGGSPDTSESEDDTDGDDVGEASDDSNDEEEDVELRKKIEEALRVNGVEAATGDSDEEELMDDEQMMAIDEQLAAVFRTRANEKRPGKDVDVQREATHFKNRVLDLVDTFAKKQPSSPLVVRLIPPLIDIVSGAGQDERQLADKAKGILRSRITKSKETPTDVDPQLISTLFSDIHTRARKVHSSDMLAIFSQCSLYLFRIQAHFHSEQPLIQTYRESLADFLTRKNSALNSHFFQEFFRRHPASAWVMRNDILELSGRAINAYRREQAHQLLETLVNQLSAMSDLNLADAAEFTTRLQKTLLQVVEDACDEKINLNAAQLKGIFKLVLVTTRQMQRIDLTWKPESWHSIAGRLGSSERFKKSPGLAKMCEQIVRTSNLPNAHKMTDPTNAPPSRAKRKAHDTVEAEDPATAAKKIKRKRVKSDKS